jgi:hypothetical protein
MDSITTASRPICCPVVPHLNNNNNVLHLFPIMHLKNRLFVSWPGFYDERVGVRILCTCQFLKHVSC